MKVNHIKDNLVDETSVNVITNEVNKNDYMYIKDLILSSSSNVMGRDLDTGIDFKVTDKDIIYFETYGRDVCFITVENKLLVLKLSMKKLEELLSNRRYFIKVNKTTIINVNHVEELSYNSNMRFQILLSNDYKQIVNRSYFNNFKKCIEEVYNK